MGFCGKNLHWDEQECHCHCRLQQWEGHSPEDMTSPTPASSQLAPSVFIEIHKTYKLWDFQIKMNAFKD